MAYLDHASTSPLRPEALDAMLPFLTEHFGNPSGSHAIARRARVAVEEARESVARAVGAEPGEVVFTAGGTESCNLAILGAARAAAAAGGPGGPDGAGGRRRVAIRCSAVEHPAVLRACIATGGPEAVVPVDRSGRVDLGALEASLGPEVALVSVMTANNETGVLQPLAAAAGMVRALAPRALVHTDAVGAGAWVDLGAGTAGADLVSLGAHKFGGPKGVGALVVRHGAHGANGARLAPVLHGGAQERERRPGTHNVAAIAGMAAALQAALAGREAESLRVATLRDRLAAGVLTVPGTHVTPSPAPEVGDVLPGTLLVRFEGVDQQELLVLLDQHGVCASAGAACASGAIEPSHVLLAMGLNPAEARQAVRFSLGWSTTEAEVARAVAAVADAVGQLRG